MSWTPQNEEECDDRFTDLVKSWIICKVISLPLLAIYYRVMWEDQSSPGG
jgi:hypothetical protein